MRFADQQRSRINTNDSRRSKRNTSPERSKRSNVEHRLTKRRMNDDEAARGRSTSARKNSFVGEPWSTVVARRGWRSAFLTSLKDEAEIALRRWVNEDREGGRWKDRDRRLERKRWGNERLSSRRKLAIRPKNESNATRRKHFSNIPCHESLHTSLFIYCLENHEDGSNKRLYLTKATLICSSVGSFKLRLERTFPCRQRRRVKGHSHLKRWKRVLTKYALAKPSCAETFSSKRATFKENNYEETALSKEQRRTTHFDDEAENESENVNIGEKPPADQIQLTRSERVPQHERKSPENDSPIGEFSQGSEEYSPVIHQHHIVENDHRGLINSQRVLDDISHFCTDEEIIEVIRPEVTLLVRSTGGIAKRVLLSSRSIVSPSSYASSPAVGALITPRKSHMPSTA